MSALDSDKAQAPACWAAFLGRALLEPDAAELYALGRELPQWAPAGLLSEVVSQAEPDILELEKEYVRLFLDPAGAPCSLWQSAQGEEPRLMGASHHGALAWYRRFGVEPRAGNEPADHAGLLLTFWSHLLSAEAAPQVRDAFFREHLAWLDTLADCITAHARHPFYLALGAAMRELLRACAPQSGSAQPA